MKENLFVFAMFICAFGWLVHWSVSLIGLVVSLSIILPMIARMTDKEFEDCVRKWY